MRNNGRYRIPIEYIISLVPLNWRELYWGYDHDYIGWSDLINYAINKVVNGSNNPLEIEMAGVLKNESWKVSDIARDLRSEDQPQDDQHIQHKWLFIVLSYIYDSSDKYSDRLTEILMVYADFEYPEEIAAFIRYMPVDKKYLTIYGHLGPEERLLKIWEDYLEKKGKFYSEIDS